MNLATALITVKQWFFGRSNRVSVDQSRTLSKSKCSLLNPIYNSSCQPSNTHWWGTLRASTLLKILLPLMLCGLHLSAHAAFTTTARTLTLIENHADIESDLSDTIEESFDSSIDISYFTLSALAPWDDRLVFAADHSVTFAEGKELDYEKDRSGFQIIIQAELTAAGRAASTVLRSPRLTLTITLNDVDERPEVSDTYAVSYDNSGAPVATDRGRQFFLLAETTNPTVIQIPIADIFSDPENLPLLLKPCGDDFEISEFDSAGNTIGANATRGNRKIDLNTSITDAADRTRHCPDATTAADVNVNAGGLVANVNSFGPVIQIYPRRGTTSGVNRAVIDFNGWAGAIIDTDSSHDAIFDPGTGKVNATTPGQVSLVARITVWVRTGVNNPPTFGATGYNATVTETIGDEEVRIGPQAVGGLFPWNATDFDTEDRKNLDYSLRGLKADTDCSEEKTAIRVGTKGCAWLKVTKANEGEASEVNNVEMYGKRLDYETAANGRYTVVLTASDGWQGESASVPIHITIRNVEEPLTYSGHPNAIRQLVTGRAGRSVDLNEVFTDPDLLPITFTLANFDATRIVATLTGSQLTVTPVGPAGTSYVTITARAGTSDINTQVIPITVRSSNLPPRFRNSAIEVSSASVNENAAVGTQLRVAGAQYLDPEGDKVTASVTNSEFFEAVVDPVQGTQTFEGFIGLKLLKELDYETRNEHRITVTLSDGWDASPVSLTIRVPVTDINEPPYRAVDDLGNVRQIPPQTVAVGGTRSLDIGEYFVDPEGQRITIQTRTSTGNTHVRVAVVGLGTIRFTGVSETQGVPAVVTVTATDGANSVEATFSISVDSNNNPRVNPARTLPPVRIQEGGNSEVSLVNSFLEDDPGDSISAYQAASSNQGVVLARVLDDGVTLYLIARASGDAVITITAVDTRGGSATTTFPVTVFRNESPTRVTGKTLGSVQITRIEPKTFNLDEYFTDPENDPLRYTVSSSNPTVVSVSITDNDNVMTLRGLRVGAGQVSVLVDDGHNQAIRDFLLVTVINIEPTAVGAIDTQSLARRETYTVDLAEFFDDPDEDDLTYSATARKNNVVRIRVTGSTLNVTAQSVDSTVVDVVARDAHGGEATQSFSVIVENQEPTVENEISSQMLARQEEINVRITNVFSDPDGDSLSYQVSVDDPEIVDVMLENNSITITGKMVGEAIVTVTANDGYNTISTDFAVTVNNVKPMLVMDIADPTTHRNKSVMVDLNKSFEDMDGDELTYTATAANLAIAKTEIDSMGVLTITGLALGSSIVTVTATDEYDESAMATFIVTVENIAPVVVMEIGDQSTYRTGTYSVDLNTVFKDDDGDPLSFVSNSSNTGIATTNTVGSTLTVTGTGVGSSEISISASDEFGGSAATEFMIVVENRAPEAVGTIPTQTTNRNVSVTVDLSPFFSDVDGDSLTYSAQASDTGIATVAINQNMLSITGVMVGTTQIVVTASDPYDATATQEFATEIENIAPMAVRELSNVVTDRTQMNVVNLDGLFADDDNDDLTLSIEVSDVSIATATLTGLTINIDPESLGRTTITITATDQFDATATASFDVIVQNLQPTVGEELAEVMLQIGGEDAEVDIADAFNDDGGTLTYTVAVTQELIATASIDGSTVTVSAVASGITQYTVVATDPEGLSNSQSARIVVSDSELRDVANLALSGFSRAVLSSVSSSVGSRLLADADGLYAPLNTIWLNDVLPGDEKVLLVDNIGHNDWNQSSDPWGADVSPSSLTARSYSTDAIHNFLEQGVALQMGAVGDPNFFSVWGAVDRQSFASDGSGYEGDATSYYFGGDYSIQGSMMFGVGIGRNAGESDYTFGDATQTMDISLTTILPYARYSPSDRTTIYGTFGFGSGELETTVIGRNNDQSDLKASIGLFGGRQYLWGSNAGMEVSVIGDFGFANLETDEGDESTASSGLVAETSRVRGGVEAGWNLAMGADGSFIPFLNLRFRSDSGDGDVDSGVELAGGLRVTNPVFSLDVNFRTLATYGVDDYSESGFSATAILNPMAGATGLKISVAPSWGAEARSTDEIWQDNNRMVGFNRLAVFGQRDATMSLKSHIGYGIPVRGEQMLLTPFVDLSSSNDGYSQFNVGAKLAPFVKRTQSFDIDVLLGLRTDQQDNARETARLRARLNF